MDTIKMCQASLKLQRQQIRSSCCLIWQWKAWEDLIAKDNYETEQVLNQSSLMSINMNSSRVAFWIMAIHQLHSFFKQFYGSVSKSDYMTLRLGFIMMTCFCLAAELILLQMHCRGNPKFNFHKYMICALEDDFKKVVGIRQVIARASLVQYGFDSCIMGHLCYIVPRLYWNYKTVDWPSRAIFDKPMQVGLVEWAQQAKKKKHLKKSRNGSGEENANGVSAIGIQPGRNAARESAPEEI
ncbi:unnamed protein product [Thlaspi arvense]|uniref:Uncharacterized protein n=1 Tax=Thlaspi arvense TaxID=13288 RepID=A0AAU9RFM8_THLAR|nr:unnamed protein product [Thlaspi arvense]